MVPYLKGLHLTIDAWRPNRDFEGWKLVGREISGNIDEEVLDRHEGPAFAQAVPRLEGDLEALQAITQSANPPLCEGLGERKLQWPFT